MDDNEEGRITVLHQKGKLPLFHMGYEIIIAEDPILAKEVIEEIWPGVSMPFTNKTLSYSCGIEHELIGDGIVVYIRAGKNVDPNQSIESIVAHEANNLAWLMTKELSIPIKYGNHILHSYITSELVQRITCTLRDFEENSSDIDSL